jgi:hypothetical protein
VPVVVPRVESRVAPDVTVGAGVACADLTTFCRLDELGLGVTGQRLDPDCAVLACRVVEPDQGLRVGGIAAGSVLTR